MSCAARITSPTRRCRSRFSALGAAPPVFAHHNLLTTASGEGLSKRSGALSIGGLREAGVESLAVAALAVLTGSSESVHPVTRLDDLVHAIDLSAISRNAARFDPAELDSLNARILHAMPYDTARPRLEALGLASEPLWLALRGNLATFGHIADLATLVNGPVTPVVADEDRDYLAQAKELLPAEPFDETTWSVWTNALKEKTGRKGRGLFHPLRLALTGREQGPELKSLLPLLGRRACLDRLP